VVVELRMSPRRSVSVGQHEDVEGVGAGSGTEGLEPLAQDPLVGNEIDEHTQWRKLELVARVPIGIWG
jgi:hypothetical protein